MQLFTKANNFNKPKISVQQVLGMNYIRYDRLIDIINSAFIGSTANEVDIYIDIYSMLKPLYKADYYNIEDYVNITSNIVNICAHYREFFKTRYSVTSKIYLVYSKNVPNMNKSLVEGYNQATEMSYHTNRLVDDMIEHNMKLLRLLCSYLPDIFLIETGFEAGVVMYDLMQKSKDPSIVITKDQYLYQLAGVCRDTTIIRPKKNKGNDESYYINKFNAMQYYILDNKLKLKPEYGRLDSGLISLIMTASSVKERSIKSANTMNRDVALKRILHFVENEGLLNGYNTLSIAASCFCQDKPAERVEAFHNRFKAIDLVHQHYVFVNSPEYLSIFNSIINLVDPETVREINNKYFRNNPLDLDRL